MSTSSTAIITADADATGLSDISLQLKSPSKLAPNRSGGGGRIPLQPSASISTSALTTTKTRRRHCGFALGLCAFLYYSVKWLVLLASVVFWNEGSSRVVFDPLPISLDFCGCALAIFSFYYILDSPKATLKERNFKSVWSFLLIPCSSLMKLFLHLLSGNNSISRIKSHPLEPSNFYFQIGEFVLLSLIYSIYVYALSMNGRSSNILACLKPFRYQLIPVVLSIHHPVVFRQNYVENC